LIAGLLVVSAAGARRMTAFAGGVFEAVAAARKR
jgi:hypothetical protein